MMKRILSLLVLVSLAVTAISRQPAAGRINIIYDTDIGNDVDDILGLAMLYNYAKQGKINLLGVTISKANPHTIPYMRMLNSYYNMPAIPLGYVYNGVTPGDGNYLKQTLEALPAAKKYYAVKDSVPEAWRLQRKLLASQPDGSVVMVAVGFHTNIARLLQSGADKYSPLSGVELVKKKVKFLSVMAGDFSRQRPEYNVRMDIPSSIILFNQWPVDMIVSDWSTGHVVKYPVSSILHDFTPATTNPVAISYSRYKKMTYENPAWDLLSVLEAVEPSKGYFTYSQPGNVKISAEGNTEFIAEANGRCRYMLPLSDTGIAYVRQVLQARATGKKEPVTIHPKVSLALFADGINHWSFSNALAESTYERFTPDQSIFIADNFIKYQNADGGWLKNVDWLGKLDPEKVRAGLPKEKHKLSTLDNRNTYAQIEYLSKVYYATGIEKYRAAAERGIDYILSLQNKSGGWRGWDVDAITYNDDVMTGVMNLWLDITEKNENYYWISEEKRNVIQQSLQRAIDVTLNSQVTVNGVKTGWCQQHDHITLLPTKARTYELPSLSPPESASVLEFLMRIENPDQRIVNAVESGVQWLRKVKIDGWRLQKIPVNKQEHPELTRGYDLVMVKDAAAPPLWARYYEINDNTPFLATREGKKVYSLKEVDPERRTGYGWYSGSPQSLLQKIYPAWKKNLTTKK